MRIIFIASLSHSGSTLLDLLLNAHPQVASVGELKQLGRFAGFQKRRVWHGCTCGAATLWDCPFWSRVSALAEEATGKTIEELNVENYADVESFQMDNVTLFNAIAAASGKTYIVDSSKSRSRLKLLMDNPSLDVFPVFLVRNPKGQVSSLLKKSKSKGDKKKHGTNIYEIIADYVKTNREIYSIVKDHPHLVVRYESLAHRPERTLKMLMEAIGLAFDPVQLNWAAQERHNVGGNGVRRETASDIRLDERWRQRLSRPQKLAIDIGTIRGRYPFFKLGFRTR